MQCKTAVYPLLTHWRYCSLALSHRNVLDMFENDSRMIVVVRTSMWCLSARHDYHPLRNVTQLSNGHRNLGENISLYSRWALYLLMTCVFGQLRLRYRLNWQPTFYEEHKNIMFLYLMRIELSWVSQHNGSMWTKCSFGMANSFSSPCCLSTWKKVFMWYISHLRTHHTVANECEKWLRHNEMMGTFHVPCICHWGHPEI